MDELFTPLELFLVTAGGKLSEQIISSIKELPWFTGLSEQAGAASARLLSIAITIAAGWFIGWMAVRADILIDTMPIKIGIGTYVMSQAWFVAGKMAKKTNTPDDANG